MDYQHCLIIAPSALEADFYFAHLQQAQTLNFDFKCQSGLLNNKQVTVAQTGLGKLNAGLATYQILQANLQFDLVISTGIGGINSQQGQAGDLVLADLVQDSDFGYLFDGGIRAKLNIEIPGLQIPLNPQLNEQVEKFSETYDFVDLPAEIVEYNAKYGKKRPKNCLQISPCLSGDVFGHGSDSVNWYQQLQPDYGLLDMESYAVCKVAQIYQIPSLILKGACNFDQPWPGLTRGAESQKGGLQHAEWVAAQTFNFIYSLSLEDC